MLTELIKGDTIELTITANVDITGWKIRCEIYDNSGHTIKLATENSGGSDDQIEITDETNGVFVVKSAKNITTDFDTDSFIEIEIEDANGKVITIYQDSVQFKSEKITWETPS